MTSALFISMLIFLPIIIIIVVVLIHSRKQSEKRKNELISVYKEIVAGDELEIVDEEILFNKIFAVDQQKKTFVFVHNHDKPVYDIIHLNGLSGCAVEKKGTKLVTRSNGKTITDLHVNELFLSFLSRDSVVTSLLVYSEILDGQQEYVALTKTAENWKEKLNIIIQAQ